MIRGFFCLAPMFEMGKMVMRNDDPSKPKLVPVLEATDITGNQYRIFSSNIQTPGLPILRFGQQADFEPDGRVARNISRFVPPYREKKEYRETVAAIARSNGASGYVPATVVGSDKYHNVVLRLSDGSIVQLAENFRFIKRLGSDHVEFAVRFQPYVKLEGGKVVKAIYLEEEQKKANINTEDHGRLNQTPPLKHDSSAPRMRTEMRSRTTSVRTNTRPCYEDILAGKHGKIYSGNVVGKNSEGSWEIREEKTNEPYFNTYLRLVMPDNSRCEPLAGTKVIFTLRSPYNSLGWVIPA